MTVGEILNKLDEMRGRYDDGFSSSDRSFLEDLHVRIFGKGVTNKGCSNCYRDAYLLIRGYLKRNGCMPKLSNYCLKAGIVLHKFGSADYYTLSVSDEVAEGYLRENADNIKDFQRFPGDWRERIAAAPGVVAQNETEADASGTVAGEPKAKLSGTVATATVAAATVKRGRGRKVK